MSRLWPVRESSATLAVLRVGLALLIGCDTLATWRYSVELYSQSGPAMPYFQPAPPPSAMAREHGLAPQWEPTSGLRPGEADRVRDSIQPGPLPEVRGDRSRQHEPGHVSMRQTPRSLGWGVPPAWLAVGGQTLLLFSTLCLAAGWYSGWSLLCCFVLLAWLRPLDLSWTFAKPTIIWLHMLLLLSLDDCGGWLTLRSRGRAVPPVESGGLSRWLLQVLVCQIYAGAALTKLQSGWFASGELLQYSLLDRQYGGTTLGRWLAATPGLARPLSLATLLFELLFPVLVWVPSCRRVLLFAAVGFHLAVWGCLHVDLFSPTLLVLLLAFVEPTTTQKLLGQVRCNWRFAKPMRWGTGLVRASVGPTDFRKGSIGVWWATAAGVGLLGCAVQWSADWYGAFGRIPLPPLDETTRAVWGEITRQSTPSRDWSVHRIAVGTRLTRSGVWGDPRHSRRGESLYVGVQFSVPHPPLQLEGILLTDTGRELARFSHSVAGDVSHTVDGFALTDDLPEGGGRVWLLIDGEDLTIRPVCWDP